MAAGVHVPLRFLRAALKKGICLLKIHFPAAQQTTKALQPFYARLPAQGGSRLHWALRHKVGGRWYSTSINNFIRYAGGLKPTPRARLAIGRITTTSPFASALRPKLVGGAFPRSAGGYSLGGNGARFFSNGPAAPAQVMSQVTSAMRAFTLSGKDQMSFHRGDGTMGRLGVRAQLAASLVEEENAPGAYVDFYLSPTLTCLSPLNTKQNAAATLENANFMQSLSADFGAMVGGLTAIYADLQRLSTLGDLPITLAGPAGDILRVHFKGCEREFVERLCDEVGVRRGIVHEDEKFAVSMLAPGAGGEATSSWREMMSDSPPLSTTYSEDGFDDEYSDDDDDGSGPMRISGSDSYAESDFFSEIEPGAGAVYVQSPTSGGNNSSSSSSGLERSFEGLEGIHRFLEACGEYGDGNVRSRV